MANEYQRYPLWMKHPSETAAVICDDYADGERRATQALPGQPARFPPVQVNNADQEEYQASRGYVPAGNGDAKAAERARVAPLPQGYTHQSYPMMVDGKIVNDPNATPPDDHEYPKWVHFDDGRPAKLVQNRAEELSIKPPPPSPEPSEAEREFWAALSEAQEDPTDTDLMTQAKELGIKVDKRWGEARLRAEIERRA